MNSKNIKKIHPDCMENKIQTQMTVVTKHQQKYGSLKTDYN